MRKEPGREADYDYAARAQEILKKQRERLLDICRAYLDHAGWMRDCDLSEDEKYVRDQLRAFVENNRNGRKSA